jgi:hypothetical protein
MTAASFVISFAVLCLMSAIRIGKESHLKVSYELLHDGLPCNETLDEDVRRSEVMGAMFFLMRNREQEMVEPCLLAREMDVALESEALSLSFIVVIVTRPQTGPH